jgi:hypothetical protein
VPEIAADPTALLDVSRFVEDVRRVMEASERRDGEIIFSIGYDTSGVNIRREVIHQTVGFAVADSARSLLFEALDEAPSVAEPWGFRLAVEPNPGEQARIGVAGQLYCPPHPRNPVLARDAEFRPLREVQRHRGRRTRVVEIDLMISPAGYVIGGVAARGVGSGTLLEREIIRYASQYQFYPATLDGEPTDGSFRARFLVPD